MLLRLEQGAQNRRSLAERAPPAHLDQGELVLYLPGAALGVLGPLLGSRGSALGVLAGQLLQIPLLVGLDDLDVRLGRFHRKSLRQKVVASITALDVHHLADCAQVGYVSS